MTPTPRFIHYLELKVLEPSGNTPLETLRGWKAVLERAPGCLSALLLHSPQQPGVYLLQTGWTAPMPPLERAAPAGCKLSAWTFEVLEG